MTIDKYLSEKNGIENELYKFFSSNDELIIFDIGSCEGEDSIRYSRMFPRSKIYSFEPLTKNLKKAEENLKKFSIENVTLTQEALSDREGESEFHTSSGHPDYIPITEEWDYGNKSSSLLLPTSEMPNWMKFEKEIVKTNTLQNFCTKNNIENIDFIHMDVQGAEKLVLAGAENMLNKIKMIWLEVGMVEFYKEQPLKQEMISFLAENDFIVIKDTCPSICGDILVIKKHLLK